MKRLPSSTSGWDTEEAVAELARDGEDAKLLAVGRA